MAHIDIPEGLAGPRGPMTLRPETAAPLSQLAEVLLRGPSTLTRAERELIGTFVSSENNCQYCQTIHGAGAAHYLGGDEALVRSVKRDYLCAEISPKLKTLLNIASKVQQGGKHVTGEDIEHTRSLGATDLEIHDTVLIAASFCMMNRYVDGLAAWTPESEDFYRDRAATLAEQGYAGSVSR
jgi:uncharacterized peroxidase-related enzyme